MESDLKKPILNSEVNTAVKLALTGYFAFMLGVAIQIGSNKVCNTFYTEPSNITECQSSLSELGQVMAWGGAYALLIGLKANSKMEIEDLPKE